MVSGSVCKEVQDMAYGTVNVPQKEQNITVDAALSSTSTNPVQNKVVQAALALKAALSHVHAEATTAAAGFMSASDKQKLDGIAAGANKYTHPSYTAKSAGLYKVTVDSTGHVSAVSAVTKTDITALGIPAQDTNTTYSNMTAATASAAGKAGLVPAPAAGAQAKFLRGDGTWQTPTNTTYGVATENASGLMSADDYNLLHKLANGVSQVVASSGYTIPTAKAAGSATITLNASCDYVECNGNIVTNGSSTKFSVASASVGDQTVANMSRTITLDLTNGKTLAVSWTALAYDWQKGVNLSFAGYKNL